MKRTRFMHSLSASLSKFGHQLHTTKETSIDQGPVLQIVIQTLENDWKNVLANAIDNKPQF